MQCAVCSICSISSTHIAIIHNYKAMVNILIKSSHYCLKQNGENGK